MKIFGLTITKTAKYDEAIRAAKHEGLYDIVDLLKKKDKIYLSQVTLEGDGHTISDCVFFSQDNKPGLYIPSRDAYREKKK